MDTDENAWGQYIDPPRHRDHVGIYGTSSAVKTLGSGDTDEYLDDVEKAQGWLVEDQWEDEDSLTVEKGHRAVLYKFAYLLMAIEIGRDKEELDPFEDDSHEEKFNEYCEQLWERKKDWGWGEFWYDGGSDVRPSTDTSALALSILANCEQIRTEQDFRNVLKKVAGRALRNASSVTRGSLEQKSVLTDTALTLYALSVYNNTADRTGDWLDDKISDLVDEVTDFASSAEVAADTYDFRFFSTPQDPTGVDREELVEDRYIIHIVYPIVALSLIDAGEKYVADNYRLINNIIQTYVTEIQNSDKNAYVSQETEKAAHIDQFWIAQSLQSFYNIDEEEIPLTTLFKRWTVPGIGGTIIVLAIVGVLLGGTWYLRQFQNFGAWVVQTLLALGAGYILKWEFGDWVKQGINRLKSVFQ